MQKIIARILLVPYIFSAIISVPSVSAAGTFDVTMYGADVSTTGTSTSWAAGTSIKPGEYIRLVSAATNNTSAAGTSIQMNFFNAAGDVNYISCVKLNQVV